MVGALLKMKVRNNEKTRIRPPQPPAPCRNKADPGDLDPGTDRRVCRRKGGWTHGVWVTRTADNVNKRAGLSCGGGFRRMAAMVRLPQFKRRD
jgi:hypothetical protein